MGYRALKQCPQEIPLGKLQCTNLHAALTDCHIDREWRLNPLFYILQMYGKFVFRSGIIGEEIDRCLFPSVDLMENRFIDNNQDKKRQKSLVSC